MSLENFSFMQTTGKSQLGGGGGAEEKKKSVYKKDGLQIDDALIPDLQAWKSAASTAWWQGMMLIILAQGKRESHTFPVAGLHLQFSLHSRLINSRDSENDCNHYLNLLTLNNSPAIKYGELKPSKRTTIMLFWIHWFLFIKEHSPKPR